MNTAKRPFFIAEVKTKSPYGWESDRSWDELFDLAAEHGDMISVHTDPRWGGSMNLVAKARRLTGKPILAKGVHASDAEVREALEAGASKVLVVGRVPADYLGHCLLEPLSLEELSEYPESAQAVWNSRDLATGGLKQTGFDQARALWPGWLCQASNIRGPADIQKGADAILVGSALAEFIQAWE